MTQKRKNDDNNSMVILFGVIGVAVVVAAVAILLLSNPTASTADVNYDTIEQTRRADGGFVLGDSNAPVTIVAFEDFLCPHCQSYQPTIHEFIEQYVATGQARFEFRMLPAVDPTYSRIAGQAAECSAELEPGSFWTAHDLIFQIASTERFSAESVRKFAQQMGFNYNELLDCMSDANQTSVDAQLASSSQVTGTPTVMVRYADGALRPFPGSTRPNIQQLGAFVEANQ